MKIDLLVHPEWQHVKMAMHTNILIWGASSSYLAGPAITPDPKMELQAGGSKKEFCTPGVYP